MADTAKGSAAARADRRTSSESPTVLRPGDSICSHLACRAGTVVKVYADGSACICWDDGAPQPEGLGHERVPASLLRRADTQEAKRETGARRLQQEVDGPVPVQTTARVTFLSTSRVGNDGGDLLAVNAGVPAEDAIAEALDLLHIAAISLADLSAREYDVPGDLIAPAGHLISTARQILFAVQLGDAGGSGHE